VSHDVFISYSSQDKAVADAAVAALEAEGIRCWYAPRDVPPGSDWGESIAEAVESGRVFVLIFSAGANRSQRVLDELNLAINHEAAVLPFRIEQLDPSGAMLLHLSTRHWLDAHTPSWDTHLEELVESVQAMLASGGSAVLGGLLGTRRRRRWGLALAAALIAVAGIGGWWLATGEDSSAVVASEDSTTTSSTSTSTTPSTTTTSTTLPPAPAIGSEENPLVWTFTDPSLFSFTEVLAIAEDTMSRFMEEHPGTSIRIEAAASRQGIVDALCEGEAHLGSFGPFSYIMAADQGCAEAEIIWSRFGDIDYAGMTVVRTGSDVTGFEDLAGRVFCIPGYDSVSGWVLPSLEIRAEIGNPAEYFGEIVNTEAHDEVLRAVLDGRCDAGTAFYDARAMTGVPGAVENLEIIATTDPMPLANFAFSPDVPEDLVRDLVDHLVTVSQESNDLAKVANIDSAEGEEVPRLVTIGDAYYDELRAILEAGGATAEEYLFLDF
jgi:phosphate/phosphite/phosphonate ABC transporter binding protein